VEIKEEIAQECSKFGTIMHIHVDKNSNGFVYIKFGSVPSAQNAINALNGRWFDGRVVSATFFPEGRYNKLFQL
jgi:RNA-binding protein 39